MCPNVLKKNIRLVYFLSNKLGRSLWRYVTFTIGPYTTGQSDTQGHNKADIDFYWGHSPYMRIYSAV